MNKMPLELIYYGRLGKSRGIKGGLKIYPEEKFEEYVDVYDFIFVKLLGNLVPLKVDRYEQKGDMLIFIDNINSPDEAKKYSGLDVYINMNEFPDVDWSELINNNKDLDILIGYDLKDENSGQSGRIEEVVYSEFQSLLIVNMGEHRSYVPLADEFVIDIDHEKQELILNLPAGILENKI